MRYKTLWIIATCIGMLFTLRPSVLAQDITDQDTNGTNRQTFKYIVSTVGGSALGAGLGFLLGGGLKTGKLALIGGGGASAWFLHTLQKPSFPDLCSLGDNQLKAELFCSFSRQ